MRDDLRAHPASRPAAARPAVPPAPAVAPAPGAAGRHRQFVLLGLAAALALAAETAALAARSGIVSDGPAAALAVLRVGLGIPAVLCVPGYALTVFLYPRGRDLDAFERIALTVGLSVAQIPLVVLLVDRSPWGLSPPATVASLDRPLLSVVLPRSAAGERGCRRRSPMGGGPWRAGAWRRRRRGAGARCGTGRA